MKYYVKNQTPATTLFFFSSSTTFHIPVTAEKEIRKSVVTRTEDK